MGADQRLNDADAHEELLGEPAAGVAQKQTVDALLGRPYVAERSEAAPTTPPARRRSASPISRS